MYMFIMPSTMRKVADTEVPTIPPTFEKLSNRFETADAVAATTMDVIITILHFISTSRRETRARHALSDPERTMFQR